MTVRKILTYPNLILNQLSQPLTSIDENAKRLMQDLIDTLNATTGVGLAAPQIGINKRVIVYAHERHSDKANFRVVINPHITQHSGEQISKQEGCKSLPGLRLNILRSESIRVDGQDAMGNSIHIDASGFEAIVLQHEIDHLDGILIIDHVANTDKGRYRWYARNLERITRKLEWLFNEPEGILYHRQTVTQNIVIVKDDTEIKLYFAAPASSDQQTQFRQIISHINIEDPIRLSGVCPQAMMLSLLWQDAPTRIHMLGFGGGRISMVLHHYLPEVVIDGTEIDPFMVNLAAKYFGISYDDRLSVTASDGREYLAKLATETKYDIILIDCINASGHHPYNLSTSEFYDLCIDHLAETGIVAVNILERDPMFSDKIWTFRTKFRNVYAFVHEGTHVFFGTNREVVLPPTLLERAQSLTVRYQFRFPFLEWAQQLILLPSTSLTIAPEQRILTDNLLQEYSTFLSLNQDLTFHSVGRNDPCPCGSGRKFKHCHGKK